MQWAVISERGAREINEDRVGVYDRDGRRLFVVADGLGGHRRGDAAAALAVGAFEEVLSAGSGASLPALLSDGFSRAQAAILAGQARDGDCFQMKTTACALAWDGRKIAWGHIGDSRIYAFSRGRIRHRTLDHSVPQMLALAREIPESEIRGHPDRNKLLRVLGIPGAPPRFELSDPCSARKFQAFLLCSDGFWELILEEEMCALLRQSASASEWLRQMQEVVERRGASTDMDNYSAVAVWL